MSLLLNDDILDYLKCHLDINDYDKMKKVSVKHRYLFDLKPLLFNKYYDKLLNIQGSSVEMILKIIDYNVRKKYKFKKNKTIIKKLLKYSNYIEISINNNNIFIIEYLIDILYNTSKKKYENLKNIIIELYNNDKLYYGDIGDFCASLTIITKYFKNDLDNYLETAFYLRSVYWYCKANRINFMYGSVFNTILPLNEVYNTEENFHNYISYDCVSKYLDDKNKRVWAHCGHPNSDGYYIIANKIFQIMNHNFEYML